MELIQAKVYDAELARSLAATLGKLSRQVASTKRALLAATIRNEATWHAFLAALGVPIHGVDHTAF